MDKYEQRQLAWQLIQSITAEVLGNIEQGRTPETWDGTELRQYIADKFTELSVIRRMDRKRAREYRNEVIVRNL